MPPSHSSTAAVAVERALSSKGIGNWLLVDDCIRCNYLEEHIMGMGFIILNKRRMYK